MRRVLMFAMLAAACRPGAVAERSEMLPALCEDYCPRRVTCVGDGFAKNDALVCTQMCVREERYVSAGACGEASFALLECMAALTCEELPLAVDALAQGDESVSCYAEQVDQRELCTFEIVR
jgi:hypothetical protein